MISIYINNIKVMTLKKWNYLLHKNKANNKHFDNRYKTN